MCPIPTHFSVRTIAEGKELLNRRLLHRLLNGALRKSVQLSDEVRDQPDVDNLIDGGELSKENAFHDTRRCSKEAEVFG